MYIGEGSVLGVPLGLCSGTLCCRPHLSGNSRVVWTNDDQRGANRGSLWLHVHAGRHNVESFRLDVDSLQEKPFEHQSTRALHNASWVVSLSCSPVQTGLYQTDSQTDKGDTLRLTVSPYGPVHHAAEACVLEPLMSVHNTRTTCNQAHIEIGAGGCAHGGSQQCVFSPQK